ncbi:TIM barrel protein [Pseudarthrobacter phenanthrenivorans]|uniref:TIM barrel protein n=1 Tax=Pseudarthrobacter phenanthrenivorans TaxID=361575 RepID=UPI00344F644B
MSTNSPPLQLSANVEWLFAEAGDDTAARAAAAAAAGLTGIEIWGWKDKDTVDLARVCKETGLHLVSMIVDPQLQITDRDNLRSFLVAVEEAATIAANLECSNLVVVAGDDTGQEADRQYDNVRAALSAGADILKGTGTRLLLEPLNSNVHYHSSSYLTSTATGLDLVRDVASDALRLLFDVYHSAMMDESPLQAIEGSLSWIGHVQVADIPERSEPGTGNLDWNALLKGIIASGYEGYIGLEYQPTTSTTESLLHIQKILSSALA